MILQFIEPQTIANLFPLTQTRPAADLRCGILTIAEKWAYDLGVPQSSVGYITRDYLQAEGSPYPSLPQGSPAIYINGSALPNPNVIQAVKSLTLGQALMHNGHRVAYHGTQVNDTPSSTQLFEDTLDWIERPYHIFTLNGKEIVQDFARVTAGRSSITPSDTNKIISSKPSMLMR